MARERKSFDESKIICARPYILEVTTKSHYWKGDGAGASMGGSPGWFMDHELSLLEIEVDDNPIHAIASKKLPIKLMNKHREVTNEPIGYVSLCHSDFVENVKDNPFEYISERILRSKL